MKENKPLAVVKDKTLPNNDSNSNDSMKLTSFPPSSTSSPLNLLADVAASKQSDTENGIGGKGDSNKYSFDQKQTLSDTKAVTLTTDSAAAEPAEVTSKSSTLRELLTKTAGRIGRPVTTMSGAMDGTTFLTAILPNKAESANKRPLGSMTSTFEDIIATVVEQNIASPAMRHERTFSRNHFMRPLSSAQPMANQQPEYTLVSSISTNSTNTTPTITPSNPPPPAPSNNKLSPTTVESSPVRHTLTETSVQYPDVPHSWLQDGRLLRLHDPQHKGNLDIFQGQWTRGEVSDEKSKYFDQAG